VKTTPVPRKVHKGNKPVKKIGDNVMREAKREPEKNHAEKNSEKKGRGRGVDRLGRVQSKSITTNPRLRLTRGRAPAKRGEGKNITGLGRNWGIRKNKRRSTQKKKRLSGDRERGVRKLKKSNKRMPPPLGGGKKKEAEGKYTFGRHEKKTDEKFNCPKERQKKNVLASIHVIKKKKTKTSQEEWPKKPGRKSGGTTSIMGKTSQ